MDLRKENQDLNKIKFKIKNENLGEIILKELSRSIK